MKVPAGVVERANLPRLEPAADTCEEQNVTEAGSVKATSDRSRDITLQQRQRNRVKMHARSAAILTMKVECMVAHAPRNVAVVGRRRLVCLALDARIHDVIAANCAVVHNHVYAEK